jgi:hypothetical protein
MQRQHSYSSRRRPAPSPRWYVRPDAAVDADPLPARPATRARTIKIREAFLSLGDTATLLDVLEICDADGLLDGLLDTSAVQTVLTAIRAVGSPSYWDSAEHHARIHAASAPDAPRVRLR